MQSCVHSLTGRTPPYRWRSSEAPSSDSARVTHWPACRPTVDTRDSNTSPRAAGVDTRVRSVASETGSVCEERGTGWRGRTGAEVGGCVDGRGGQRLWGGRTGEEGREGQRKRRQANGDVSKS
eukprot:349650-Chlamydomonas_euryale.AAC.3